MKFMSSGESVREAAVRLQATWRSLRKPGIVQATRGWFRTYRWATAERSAVVHTKQQFALPACILDAGVRVLKILSHALESFGVVPRQ